ncbi:MAG: hypothetical protein JW727_01800 [Candidatus Aenigmarchaeota archaeon]|nr:hypothetical protein [Candidatus Aenigmarchaeota archaeon]
MRDIIKLRVKEQEFEVPSGIRLDTACWRVLNTSITPDIAEVLRSIGTMGFKKARGMEVPKVRLNGKFVDVDAKLTQDCEVDLG